MIAALDDFGFASLGLTADDFCEPESVIQLGFPPKRIDILTSADGIAFENCNPNRIGIAIKEVNRPVPFISLDDLLANKKASGRPQDLANLVSLSPRDQT